MKSFFISSLLVLASVLLTYQPGFSDTPLPQSHSLADFISVESSADAYNAKVRVYNRTDWNVKVVIDGQYRGDLWGDHYQVYGVLAGNHRVTVYWPSGYYEYFDFGVCYGCVHKIATSDYDG